MSSNFNLSILTLIITVHSLHQLNHLVSKILKFIIFNLYVALQADRSYVYYIHKNIQISAYLISSITNIFFPSSEIKMSKCARSVNENTQECIVF